MANFNVFIDNEAQDLSPRELGILSWLEHRGGLTVRQIADMYAAGLGEHDALNSRLRTTAAAGRLADRGMVRTQIITMSVEPETLGRRATEPTVDVSTVSLTLGPNAPKPDARALGAELTPIEQSFVGLLRGGEERTVADLEGGIPFAVGREPGNEPSRTEAYISHLVALGMAEHVGDGQYRGVIGPMNGNAVGAHTPMH